MPNPTDLAIRAAKPGTILWDSTLRGFGVRVGKNRRTFIILAGPGRRVAIGHYGLMSLQEARTEARRRLAEKVLGRVQPDRVPFEVAVRDFLKECETKNRARTVADYWRLLSRHYPFGRTPIAEVRPRDIVSRMNALNATPVEKQHAFMAGRVFFNWAVRQHLIDRSPMLNMAAPSKGPSRDRVLTEAELRRLWKALQGPQTGFKALVRLLILLGQRRTETSRLEWAWIDEAERTITFPPDVTKNGRRHTIPYGPLTAETLASMPRPSETYVFPAQRDRFKGTPAQTMGGFGKPMARLRAELGDEVGPFTLHDLRRTLSSSWAKLGIPQVVTEKYLNHVSGGTLSPIAQTYNRHAYLDEMREAALKWERYITSL